MLAQVPHNTVLQGDVLEQLRKLPADCVDVVVTSPPYWGLRDYGDDRQIGLEKHPSEYIAKIAEVCLEVKRVLKPSGSFWLNLGDTYFGGGGGNQYSPNNTGITSKQFKADPEREKACGFSYSYRNKVRSNWLQPKQKMLIPARVAIALQDQGWILRNEIVWHKVNHMPESCRDRLTRSWESVFFFVKNDRYYFDLDAIRKPLTETTIQRVQRPYKNKQKFIADNLSNTRAQAWADKVVNNYDGKFEGYGQESEKYGSPRARNERKRINQKNNPHYMRDTPENHSITNPDRPNDFSHPNGANPGDVWSLTTEGLKDEHFAAFPQKLVKRILECACPKGGLVLDPFAGAGTSLLVAHKMGFDWLGIELVPKYCEIIEKRIERHGKVRLDKFMFSNSSEKNGGANE